MHFLGTRRVPKVCSKQPVSCSRNRVAQLAGKGLQVLELLLALLWRGEHCNVGDPGRRGENLERPGMQLVVEIVPERVNLQGVC